jgi:DNA-binding PadR family transcriptional regulator
MSLPHALLTSLIEKSSSGFDLARRFDKSIGYFWHATHQQIYRELARMETLGWIESHPARDAGKTRKREYCVLPAGSEELLRWSAELTPPVDFRDAMLVKLRAAAALPGGDLRDEVRRHIALHQEKLKHYRAIETRDFQSGKPLTREARIHWMILKKGILLEEGAIAWNREMLEVLQAAPDSAKDFGA